MLKYNFSNFFNFFFGYSIANYHKKCSKMELKNRRKSQHIYLTLNNTVLYSFIVYIVIKKFYSPFQFSHVKVHIPTKINLFNTFSNTPKTSDNTLHIPLNHLILPVFNWPIFVVFFYSFFFFFFFKPFLTQFQPNNTVTLILILSLP